MQQKKREKKVPEPQRVPTKRVGTKSMRELHSRVKKLKNAGVKGKAINVILTLELKNTVLNRMKEKTPAIVELGKLIRNTRRMEIELSRNRGKKEFLWSRLLHYAKAPWR